MTQLNTPVVDDKSTELTGAQEQSVSVAFNDVDVQSITLPATMATYRTMRKHPTIAIGREMAIAPIVIGEWSVTNEPDVPEEIVEFITREFLALREPFVRTMMEGTVDFGWQPFELVFHTKQDIGGASRIGLKKIKPLLQDITEILIETKTGSFAGFRQKDAGGNDIDLPIEQCFLFSRGVEGTYWYGMPLIENVRDTYNKWVTTMDAAQRHYSKTAGALYTIKYPVGKTEYNGAETDNDTIAENIGDSLKSSGVLKIPRKMDDVMMKMAGEQQEDSWIIDMLESNSAHGQAYIDGMKYLDSQMLRGMIIPERSVTEGQHGTKAEASVHFDAALIAGEVINRNIARMVTWHMVNRLVLLNWGEQYVGKVAIQASPLIDEQVAFLRKIYMQVLTNSTTAFEEMSTIDTDAIKDQLGVPKNDVVTDTTDDNDTDPDDDVDPTEVDDDDEVEVDDEEDNDE